MSTIAESLRLVQGAVSRPEARLLLAFALGKPKEFLIAHPEAEVSGAALEVFARAAAQARAGVPIPYITGVQEFWGRPFKVTPDTLIPRPDTETLIEEALAILKDKPTSRVLDLGTGSGCIAVTLALEYPAARVCACDVSPAALAVAQDNAAHLGAAVDFVESNWFSAFAGRTFDLIVSNPPYIEEGDAHLAALAHEPISALTSGADGLNDIRILDRDAGIHLAPGGFILVEHGYNQGESAANIFRSAGFSEVHTVHDLGGNPRVCAARRLP